MKICIKQPSLLLLIIIIIPHAYKLINTFHRDPKNTSQTLINLTILLRGMKSDYPNGVNEEIQAS